MTDLFNPTPEHRALRELVRSFTEREVEPQAEPFDRDERFNVELFAKLGELGLLGITVEERFGVRASHPQLAEGGLVEDGGILVGRAHLAAHLLELSSQVGDPPANQPSICLELRLTGASVACTDQEQDRHPARHAARGGLGAVMGSKRRSPITLVGPKSRTAERRPSLTTRFAGCRSA